MDFFQVDPIQAYGVNSLSVFGNVASEEGFSFGEGNDDSFEYVKRSTVQRKTSGDIFKLPIKIENGLIGEPFESTGITQSEKQESTKFKDLNIDMAKADCEVESSGRSKKNGGNQARSMKLGENPDVPNTEECKNK